MNEQKRDFPSPPQAPKSNEGAGGTASTWRRLLAKKWVFPAAYIAAAAIILTLMWVYQGAGTLKPGKDVSMESAQQATVTENVSGSGDAVATNAKQETLQLPFKDRAALEVVLPFFDNKASSENRQAALVEYGDTFTPHIGVDYARPDNQSFEVLAVLGGKVTAVQKDPLVGNLIEITHNNGLVSVYQSLTDVKVVKDADVKKGDVIAQAGRSELEKDQGTHLHFELRQGQGGPAVNPQQYLGDH